MITTNTLTSDRYQYFTNLGTIIKDKQNPIKSQICTILVSRLGWSNVQPDLLKTILHIGIKTTDVALCETVCNRMFLGNNNQRLKTTILAIVKAISTPFNNAPDDEYWYFNRVLKITALKQLACELCQQRLSDTNLAATIENWFFNGREKETGFENKQLFDIREKDNTFFTPAKDYPRKSSYLLLRPLTALNLAAIFRIFRSP